MQYYNKEYYFLTLLSMTVTVSQFLGRYIFIIGEDENCRKAYIANSTLW